MKTRETIYQNEYHSLVLELDDVKKLLTDNGIEVGERDDINLITESNGSPSQIHHELSSGVYRVVFQVKKPCVVNRT